MAITKVVNSDSKQYKPILKDVLVLDTVPTVGSFNGVTSNGVAQAIADSGNVPTPAAGDDGKVLTVNGTAYEWADPQGADYTPGDGIVINDNTISVSDAVRSGAAAGSTAVQPGNLATVATSGSYNDLEDKPTIPSAQVNSDWNAESGVAAILNKPSLAAVATSGSYTDLSNKPNIPAAQVNSDWSASTGVAAILNKPDLSVYAQSANLATVATSGDYADLTNKPVIPAAQVQSNWNESDSSSKAYIQNKPDMTAYAQTANLATVATTGDYDDLLNKPVLATVATSGSYADLSNKPSIPAAQVNSDWNAVSGVEQILNKPNLATVATTGSYNDLQDKPTIPSAVTVDQHYDALSANPQSGTAVAEAIAGTGQVPTVTSADDNKVLMASYSGGVGSFSWEPSAAATQVNADWTATSGVAAILNKPDLSVYAQSANLATVATSGNYNDLSNRPSIPAAQVNADWDAASGVAQILNKPALATVATSGSYTDLQDKPSIPAAQVQSNWNESDNTSKAYIQNKPDLTAYALSSSLATVATSGSYNDLSNKPTIPAAQVNSDWNESSSSSKAFILNKPDLSVYAQSANLATVATSGSYNDLSNKPTIPSTKPLVAGNNITITENANDVTIAASGTTYTAGNGLSLNGTEFSADTTVLQPKLTAGSNISISANNEISATGTLPTSTSADEGKFLIVDGNGLPEWSDLSDGSSYSIANGSVVFTPGSYYTDGAVTLSNIRSNGIDYAYNHDGWVLERDHTYVIAFNIVASVGYAEPGNITGRVWLDGFQESDQVWKFSLDTSATHDESLVGSAIVCPQSTGEVHLNIRYDSNQLAHIPSASVNKAEIVDVTARVSGAGATTYSAGTGLNLTGTTFSVDTTTIATKSDLSAYTPTASLATVATTGAYSDLSGTPTISNVPAVTSSDDDKVLKASYSGGVGSYAWESEPVILGLTAGSNVTITEANNAVTIAATDTTYTAGNMIAIDSNNSNAIGVSTTAGITDIQLVNALPASPVATVFYIIPET